jgi:cytochrome c oxidase subunit 3
MGATAISTKDQNVWAVGDNQPMNASYGKMMMWFFILSDALTFTGFIAAYGFARFKFIDTWPIADEVYNHFPFLHGDHPMYFVALMTFILIGSSVTMVLAVDAGHEMKRKKVAIYMLLTIVGGLTFLGSQAWEWKNFISGYYGAIETKGGAILQFVDEKGKRVGLDEFAATDVARDRENYTSSKGIWFSESKPLSTYSVAQIKAGFAKHPNLLIRTEITHKDGNASEGLHTSLNKARHKEILTREASIAKLNDAKYVVEGASLIRNEYGHKAFGNYFFFITGFHGFHVFTGVLINIIIFLNVLLGTYEKRKSYEMVEKTGLYWHFVDLVWVFVFTFFYLV